MKLYTEEQVEQALCDLKTTIIEFFNDQMIDKESILEVPYPPLPEGIELPDNITKLGMELWEKDQQSNRSVVNPHAFLYGIRVFNKYILSKLTNK